MVIQIIFAIVKDLVSNKIRKYYIKKENKVNSALTFSFVIYNNA